MEQFELSASFVPRNRADVLKKKNRLDGRITRGVCVNKCAVKIL